MRLRRGPVAWVQLAIHRGSQSTFPSRAERTMGFSSSVGSETRYHRQGDADMVRGRATLTCGLSRPYLLLLLLAFVPHQVLGVPQLPARPIPSPANSQIRPNASSSREISTHGFPSVNRTTFSSSSEEPLNRTATTLPLPQGKDPRLSSARGRQTFNGGGLPPPLLPPPPRSSPPRGPPRTRPDMAKTKRPLRHCCPPGQVTQKNGQCVPATGPVADMAQLVGKKSCGGPFLDPVNCSLGEELVAQTITTNQLMCFIGFALFRSPAVKNDFCVGVGEKGDTFYAFRCEPKPDSDLCHSEGQTHVKKCCHCGKVMINGRCGAYEAPANTTANSKRRWPDPVQEWASKEGFAVSYEELICKKGRHKFDSFYISSGGSLVTTGTQTSDYCLDHYVFPNETTRLMAFTCIVEQRLWQYLRFVVLPIGLFISVLLLSVTLFFHLSIPQLRRTEHLYLICYMSALLISNLLLLMAQTIPYALPKVVCHATGFLIMYCTLSTFSWLTVMCIDILQTTRICNNFKEMVKKQFSTNKKNLAIYCILGFGLPLVLCIITAVMEFGFPENTSLIRPNFAKTTCFFEHHSYLPKMIYYDSPLSVLFIVNLILLGLAFRKISQFTKASQQHNTTNISLHPKKNKVPFCGKCLCDLVNRCLSKLLPDNKGKLETTCDEIEDDITDENSSGEEKSYDMDSKDLQSMATLGTSVESLPDLDHNSRNETVLSSSKDVRVNTEDFTISPSGKTSYDPTAENQKQERPARRQTTSGMRKYAKQDFTVEFWHRVFIFALMIVCWTTEVASAFIKPDELWAVTDVLNTLQGSFQFLLLLRNRSKRNICKNKYPAFFSKIDALESALKSCFSNFKSLLCQKHKVCCWVRAGNTNPSGTSSAEGKQVTNSSCNNTNTEQGLKKDTESTTETTAVQ